MNKQKITLKIWGNKVRKDISFSKLRTTFRLDDGWT